MVSKHISKPWLDYIISGEKLYEGRVNKGFWKNLVVDDVFTLTDNTLQVTVKVVDLKYFRDFGDAWFILQDRLIPADIYNVITLNDARNVYKDFSTREDIEKNGVVAVGLKVIK